MKARNTSILRPRRSLPGSGAGLLSLLVPLSGASGQYTPVWSGLSGGADWEVRALAGMDEDGPGPRPAALFAGGGFFTIAGIQSNLITRWDGWRTTTVGDELTPGNDGLHELRPIPAPLGLIPRGLYVAGSLTGAGALPLNNLGCWNGSDWSDVGGGVGGYLFILRTFDEDGAGPAPARLFVGGPILTAGGVPAEGLARWDGFSWSSVGGGISTGSPGTFPYAWALETYDDDGPGARPSGLYVGGNFLYAGGTFHQNMARWDGTAWETVGFGPNGAVESLCVFDEDGPGPQNAALFVGGQFNAAGGSNPVWLWGLGRWNGTSWSSVGGWQGSTVKAMAVWDEDGPGPGKPALYVGGYFPFIPGHPVANRIAKWDGQAWHPVGLGVTGFGAGTNVNAIAAFDEDGPGPNPGGLYVGGLFYYAGGVETHHIARWGCPLPPRCDANCTKDFHPITGQHILSVADFGCFQTRYVLQDPYADCNEDGQLTVADFGCFQTKFVTGCP